MPINVEDFAEQPGWWGPPPRRLSVIVMIVYHGGMITACSVRLETYLRVSMHRGREEAAMSTLSNFEKHDSSMLFSACSIQIGQEATLALALRSHVFVATLATFLYSRCLRMVPDLAYSSH